MKIAVVGATGATGRRVIKHALARGHLVTAVARHPERLSSADRLSFVRGDVLSPEGLTGALDGVEAVISCIGPEKNLSPGTLTTSEKPSSDIFSTDAPISRAVAYPSVMQDASKGHQRRLRSKR